MTRPPTRVLARLLSAQGAWARPFGDFNHGWLTSLFARLGGLKDFLNGTWLGHSLHAVLTDVPIGALTLVIVLDLLDQRTAADVALGLAILAMLAAALAGLADYTDTDGHARLVATIHGTLMTVALIVFVLSLVLRLGSGPDRGLPIVLDLIGYLILAAAAWLGGEVVYALGNMVNRHAWRFTAMPKWEPLDVTEIPEGQLVRANAGAQQLVLVRQGDSILALHDRCAHAGGPLSKGTIVDGCVECPWHGSRFDLSTGFRRSGPTTHDQPSYVVRPRPAGGYEALRVTSGTGEPTPAPSEAG